MAGPLQTIGVVTVGRKVNRFKSQRQRAKEEAADALLSDCLQNLLTQILRSSVGK